MRASLEETGASKVLLVAHSAGGWLARAALAEGEWEEGVASQDVVAGERYCSRVERGGGGGLCRDLLTASFLFNFLLLLTFVLLSWQRS